MPKRRNSQDHAPRKMLAFGETIRNRQRVLQPNRSPGETTTQLPDAQTQAKMQNAVIRECLRGIDVEMADLQVKKDDLQSQFKPTNTPGRMDHESPLPIYKDLEARKEALKIKELKNQIERLEDDNKALISGKAKLAKTTKGLKRELKACQYELLSKQRELK
ncbi:hypothetical protein ACHAPU_006228 [Fusarium lateritium]